MSAKYGCAVALAVALVASISGVKSVQAQDASASLLAAQLETQYKLAKMGKDSNIMDAGTVLVIQKVGILGVPPGNPVMCPATYKDGALHAPSAVDKMLCGKDARGLSAGEKVYVLKIELNSKKDRVSLLIVECDSCNGAPQFASYKSPIIFQFPKGYLATAQAAQIEDAISQVLTVDIEANSGSENPSPVPAQGLTNDDIIKLVQAKLPDSVVITKIKSSSCDFDTTPDALINLKRAGVSDSVLQAIVDAPQSNPSESVDNASVVSASEETASAPSCGDYAACVTSARASLDASQWAQALTKLQGASQLDPSKGDVWAGMGAAYFQMGQYDDAAGAWDRALELGSALTVDVCHAAAMCGDKGTFSLSTKEISFVNKKGEKELGAAPSAVTSEGAVLLSDAQTAYYLKVRFAGKNFRFYYLPKNIGCRMGFVCPEPGLSQQKAFGDYVHDTLVKIAAGNFGSLPNRP
jgi:tetratricopeptide (TPR) repeat protein